MEINNRHLCIGCMHELHGKEICSYCGMEQKSYTPIPRCLISGTRLADRYVLGKVLGEGSFGITYIGWDSLLEIPVAIKEYYPSDLVSRDVVRGQDTAVYLYSGIEKEEYNKRLERFLKEARNLTRFNQLPSIVSVRDFFYANNTAYIVMDYIEGESLKSYIRREGPMDGREVLKVFRPVLESLEKIHVTGMIHRDISPDNLLFDENQNLVLIDFGAAELQNAELTRTVTITFKRGFSPEEQYRSHGKQGPWTDIYALCASMYFAITGDAPDEAIQRTIEDRVVPLWNRKDLSLTNVQMKAIMKGMAVHGEDRFQSVTQLYHQLYYENQVKRKPVFAKKRLMAMGAVILLLACCTGGLLWMKLLQQQNKSTEAQKASVTAADTTEDIRKNIPTEGITEQMPQTISMVSCVNRTKEDAQQILTAVRDVAFRIQWQEEYNEEVAEGLVIQQSILEGDSLMCGQEYEITLTISKGKEPVATTQMPTASPSTKTPSKKNTTEKQDDLDGFIQ